MRGGWAGGLWEITISGNICENNQTSCYCFLATG